MEWYKLTLRVKDGGDKKLYSSEAGGLEDNEQDGIIRLCHAIDESLDLIENGRPGIEDIVDSFVWSRGGPWRGRDLVMWFILAQLGKLTNCWLDERLNDHIRITIDRDSLLRAAEKEVEGDGDGMREARSTMERIIYYAEASGILEIRPIERKQEQS